MRDTSQTLFYVFAAATSLVSAVVALRYSTNDLGSVLILGLPAVLVAVIAGRKFGTFGALSSSAGGTIIVGMLTMWPTTGFLGRVDGLLTLLLLALVSAGCATYVSALGHAADQAESAQRDVSAVAQLGVGFVPRELYSHELGTLLDSIERMAGACRMGAFVPSDESRLALMPDGRETSGGDGEASRAVAQLMFESNLRLSDSAPELAGPLVTSFSDVYLPLVSGSGLEGVLRASREPGRGRWRERDIGIVSFAADLLGALIERDRLQHQVTEVRAMQEADTLKANILLSVSHDLRTPLAAAGATVAGLAQVASDSGDEKTEESLRYVLDDLAVVDWRIGELIDLSRLEASSWKPIIEWNDITDLCSGVCDSLNGRLEARVRCIIDPDTPPFQFDLVQLGRALHHIVENALVYSPDKSEVTIAVTYDDEWVRIAVSDQGPGVQPDERDYVFDKFRRGAAGATVPHGTGLGLAIASSIVSTHSGRIEVDGVQPTGARFTIVLPRQDVRMQTEHER